MVIEIQSKERCDVKLEDLASVKPFGQEGGIQGVESFDYDNARITEAELMSAPFASSGFEIEYGQLYLLAAKQATEVFSEKNGIIIGWYWLRMHHVYNTLLML